MGPLAALPVPLVAASGRDIGAHPDDPCSSRADVGRALAHRPTCRRKELWSGRSRLGAGVSPTASRRAVSAMRYERLAVRRPASAVHRRMQALGRRQGTESGTRAARGLLQLARQQVAVVAFVGRAGLADVVDEAAALTQHPQQDHCPATWRASRAQVRSWSGRRKARRAGCAVIDLPK
jgi:hypothetical protein